ncbi:MAG: hypothetical protein GXO33_02680 [Epsilonproteobacteria bacterium]|nr:hypothetical protein [Campylobacterota bacterium]
MVKVFLVGLVGGLLLLLLLFLVIVIKDHKRSKEIQEKIRKQAKEAPRDTARPAPHTSPAAQTTPPAQKPAPSERPKPKSEPQSVQEPPRQTQPPTIEAKPTDPPAPIKETKREEDPLVEEITRKDYGLFDHSRLIEEMGLAEEEVSEFIVELIHQIEAALPDIENELKAGNREKMERITHGLKGAALNLGSGGITDLLVEYNTYLKKQGEPAVIQAFQQRLKEHLSELKTRYASA